MMIDDDNDGQMIFGDLGGLKLPNICLIGEEKPQKNLTQETCPDWGSNPGLLRDWPTMVDYFKVCSDAKERVGCGKQWEATAPIQP